MKHLKDSLKESLQKPKQRRMPRIKITESEIRDFPLETLKPTGPFAKLYK